MASLVLSYLKVFLSGPVVFGVVAIVVLVLFREDIKALLLRVAKIRFPGGAEISTSQSEQQLKAESNREKPVTPIDQQLPELPGDLNQHQRQEVAALIQAERATSYLWEYRYLNYFLVYHTQQVLDWLVGSGRVAYTFYDASWLPLIPSSDERSAIISALESHHLISVIDGAIQVTPKGAEYHGWRGVLPQLSGAGVVRNS